jgi:hypothetical protein
MSPSHVHQVLPGVFFALRYATVISCEFLMAPVFATYPAYLIPTQFYHCIMCDGEYSLRVWRSSG